MRGDVVLPGALASVAPFPDACLSPLELKYGGGDAGYLKTSRAPLPTSSITSAIPRTPILAAWSVLPSMRVKVKVRAFALNLPFFEVPENVERFTR